MAGLDSQTGGFNSPYNPVNMQLNNRAADNSAIRKVNPTTTPQATPIEAELDGLETNPATAEASEIKLDTQRIQTQVHNDRNAQADSFTRASDNVGQERVAQKALGNSSQVSDKKQQENLRETRYAENLNNATLGQRIKQGIDNITQGDDPTALARLPEAVEDIDPDRKKLDKKLAQIKDRAGSKGGDFVRFVDSRRDDKGLVPGNIMELVDGFLETLRGTSLTPSEQVLDGKESLIALRDKMDSGNEDEISAFQDSLFKSYGASTTELKDIAFIRRLKDRAGELRTPPPSLNTDQKLTKQEFAAQMIEAINVGNVQAPWDLAIG